MFIYIPMDVNRPTNTNCYHNTTVLTKERMRVQGASSQGFPATSTRMFRGAIRWWWWAAQVRSRLQKASRCPAMSWQLQRALVKGNEWTYCGKAAGSNQMDIYLVGYVLKLWWSSDSTAAHSAYYFISFKPTSSSVLWKTRTGSARKHHLTLSHLWQTCFLGLFLHFIAFLELADWVNTRCCWWASRLCHFSICVALTRGTLSCLFNGEGNPRARKSRALEQLLLCREREQRGSCCSHPFPPAFSIRIIVRNSHCSFHFKYAHFSLSKLA